MLARVVQSDPFSPTLYNSPPLTVSGEQTMYIDKAIDLASSDSQFAAKLKKAIHQILTGGNSVVPTVTSLVPNSAELGSPSFVLHVHGTGFKSNSIIVFAGQEEPTTFVSDKEVTTGVNMDTWLGPDVLEVYVQTDGVNSAPMMFTFVSPALRSVQSDYSLSKTHMSAVQEGRSTKK